MTKAVLLLNGDRWFAKAGTPVGRSAGFRRKQARRRGPTRFAAVLLDAKAEAGALLGFISKELARIAQTRCQRPRGSRWHRCLSL